MPALILAALLITCGLIWIYFAARNERLKAVTGNTRHFLKVASPGIAGVVFVGIWMLVRMLWASLLQ